MALASEPAAEFQIVGAMLTDVGRVRSSNEDSVAFVIPSNNEPSARRGSLLLVADGMGGHAAGEVASALAVEVVRRVYFLLDAPVPDSLLTAFEAANRAILDHSKSNPDCKGMGTTCTALAIHDGRVWLAHVGDSRAYLLRNGKLTQLSEDQTLHAQMIRDGLVTAEEAKDSAGGNIVLQALGTRPDVEPAVWGEGISLADGDILILCSDGLTNMVPDKAIAEAAARAAPQEACSNLVAAALKAGGYDNVSVGIFAVRAKNGQATGTQTTTRRIDIAETDAEDAAFEAATTRIIKVPEGLA
ncbi:serine/threonine-protein phosphatase [Beijerinckiaceae bacterium]|nr:serine/threonine-protein phosphatase [Beijerinckiaceae bacterium]